VDFLLTVLWFLVALGVLVTFHEFGHFYIARRCGVKVLRFSVGFGKPLWSWRDKSGTEFSIAGIPLGGYVKMLDEREGDVPAELLEQTFNRKQPWQKIAIVAAGPVANFILAVLLFWVLLLQGTIDAIPLIEKVEPGSVADRAGLARGQEIIAIDGVPTPTWQQVNRQLLGRLGETGTINFTVAYPDSELRYDSEAELDGWLKGVEEPDPVAGLGLTFWEPQITLEVAVVQEASAAQRSGVAPGDLLVAADGVALTSWDEWVSYVRKRAGIPIELTLVRAGETLSVRLVPDSVEGEDGVAFGRVGVSPRAETWPEEYLRRQDYGVFGSFVAGVHRTWDTSGFVLLSLKKLIVGEISTKNLSGPITIAKVAGASAKAGMGYYIGFLALLSVSLGVFNLLPIPVLDGGHLLYYFIEVIKGSPVSERVQAFGQQLGLIMIVGVMILAFYNDVMRL
jgi:regulator of sigma E protease